MKKLYLLLFPFCFVYFALAQNHVSRFERFDIQHYDFEIHLNDSTDCIEGKTIINLKFLKPAQILPLDFVGINDSTKFGMTVSKIIYGDRSLAFTHKKDRLEIDFDFIFIQNQQISFEIHYYGIPADGLIISKNKYGDRTFFADNWPNRARHWLPTIDHPSDKATLEFRIYAPETYQVVSNGYQLEETNLNGDFKYTHWKEDVPISTKIMVIGVSRFAVLSDKEFNGIPVSSWVYPQNRDEGFTDYSVGLKPLIYFSEIIGPFPYEKLANVQSNTRYGGMENAGCIFYAESSVNGKNNAERLIVHETAHQWFGDAVTEQNWHHVWLSEGFATYLTHLYNEFYYEENYFRNQLIIDRERIIRYAHRKQAPVIDTTITNYNQLLNTNTYQKASWFLHMLREKVGYAIFLAGLQEYYRRYKNSTALTSDFQQVMEEFSGQDLDFFFNQWLYQPGHPILNISWKQKINNAIVLKINQVNKNYYFQFPLEVEFESTNGEKLIKTVNITNVKNEFPFSFKQEVKSVKLDPNVKLLYEEVQ